MEKMRVVIAGDFPLDPPNVVGGIQAVIYFTLPHLVEYPGLEIIIVTCEKWKQIDSHKPWIRHQDGWSTHYLPSFRKLPHSVTMLTTDRWHLTRTLRRLKPDLIHAHGQVAAYPWAGFDSRFPTIVTVHGINTLEARLDPRGGKWRGSIRSLLWENVEKACLRRASDIVIISPFVADIVRPHTSARLHRIENPVQPELFRLSRQTTVPGRVLYVGSIQKRKGLLDLIQAIHSLQFHIPYVHLHVAGAFASVYAQYGEQVHRLIQELALEDRVKFLGHLDREALLAEYSACSVFCLPSYLEASPVVVAEAMAAGCPVVVTDIASTAHLVEDCHNGFRATAGDSVQIAESLRAILADSQLQDRMGQLNRQIAQERFHPQKAAQAIYNLYQECLSVKRN